MFKKIIFSLTLLLSSYFGARATNNTTANIQGITVHGGLICADVLVQVWNTYTGDDGTVYNVLVGSGHIFLGPGCGLIQNPNPNCPLVDFYGTKMYTEVSSPTCATEWLNNPEISGLVTTALDDVMNSITTNQTAKKIVRSTGKEPQLSLFPNPSTGIITLHAQTTPEDSGEISFFNSEGKMMLQNLRLPISGLDKAITMKVSSLPKGFYRATMSLKSGKKLSVKFEVK